MKLEKFRCKLCNRATFSKELNFLVHSEICGKVEIFDCSKCDQNLPDFTALFYHILYVHFQDDNQISPVKNSKIQENFKCGICEKEKYFEKMADCLEHLEKNHETENGFIYCKKCKAFVYREEFLDHQYEENCSEKKIWNCAICGEKDTSKKIMNQHFKEIHGTKCVVCEFCKSFCCPKNDMDYLYNHEQSVHKMKRRWFYNPTKAPKIKEKKIESVKISPIVGKSIKKVAQKSKKITKKSKKVTKKTIEKMENIKTEIHEEMAPNFLENNNKMAQISTKDKEELYPQSVIIKEEIDPQAVITKEESEMAPNLLPKSSVNKGKMAPKPNVNNEKMAPNSISTKTYSCLACSICYKLFNQRNLLKNHKENDHGICQNCDKAYKTKIALKKHKCSPRN